MAYDQTVPQGSQQIATTQPIIQANFTYLQTGIGTEHNFDTTDATKMHHLKASMPNHAAFAPAALPTGTNGTFYVQTGGKAAFYDGTNDYILNYWTFTTTGTFATPGSSANVTIYTLPAIALMGEVYIWHYSVNQNTAGDTMAALTGQFISDGVKVIGFTNQVDAPGTDTPIRLDHTATTGLNLQGFAGSTRYENETYNYLLRYRAI